MDQDVSLADVERYNPSVDEWEMVAPLSSPRRSVAVAAHNGRLYAMGGSGRLYLHLSLSYMFQMLTLTIKKMKYRYNKVIFTPCMKYRLAFTET